MIRELIERQEYLEARLIKIEGVLMFEEDGEQGVIDEKNGEGLVGKEGDMFEDGPEEISF